MLFRSHQIYPQNIPTRGIRAITTADVEAAEKLGCVIKLIAWMKLSLIHILLL